MLGFPWQMYERSSPGATSDVLEHGEKTQYLAIAAFSRRYTRQLTPSLDFKAWDRR
jgi:hypothetical protein